VLMMLIGPARSCCLRDCTYSLSYSSVSVSSSPRTRLELVLASVLRVCPGLHRRGLVQPRTDTDSHAYGWICYGASTLVLRRP
jgi:fumarate reductase subunit D